MTPFDYAQGDKSMMNEGFYDFGLAIYDFCQLSPRLPACGIQAGFAR